MIIFAIYDKLSPETKDLIQVIENIDLLKRDLKSKYRKMLVDKDSLAIDKFNDHNLIVYGEIKYGVIKLFSKDEMKDISLTSFIGIGEVKTNGCESN